MRRSLLALLLVGAARAAHGDTGSGADVPNKSALQPLVPDVIQGANPALVTPSNQLASGAIQAAQQSTQVHVNTVPFRFMAAKRVGQFEGEWWRPIVDAISESKLTLAVDSKTNIATAAYTISYNPFAFSNERHYHTIAQLLSAADCGGTYRAATAHLSDAMHDQADAIATLSADTNSGAHAAQLAADRILVTAATAEVTRLEQFRATEQDCVRRNVFAAQWAQLYGAVPYVGFTVQAGFFPFGLGPDPSSPTAMLPLEWWEGVNMNLEIVFRPTELDILDIWGSFKDTRPTGAPRTVLATSEGFGITAGHLYGFKSQQDLKTDDAYIQDGFIAGVALGGSVQYIHCDGGQFCDSSKVHDTSFTPFVDIRLKESLQFRVSAAIDRFVTVTSSAWAVTPALTLAGTVGGN
jgi:hypothetical protein